MYLKTNSKSVIVWVEYQHGKKLCEEQASDNSLYQVMGKLNCREHDASASTESNACTEWKLWDRRPELFLLFCATCRKDHPKLCLYSLKCLTLWPQDKRYSQGSLIPSWALAMSIFKLNQSTRSNQWVWLILIPVHLLPCCSTCT